MCKSYDPGMPVVLESIFSFTLSIPLNYLLEDVKEKVLFGISSLIYLPDLVKSQVWHPCEHYVRYSVSLEGNMTKGKTLEHFTKLEVNVACF